MEHDPNEKSKCCETDHKKLHFKKEKTKKEVKFAVQILCDDWQPLYRRILKHVLLGVIKCCCKESKKGQCVCCGGQGQKEEKCKCDCKCIKKGDSKDECNPGCTCGCNLKCTCLNKCSCKGDSEDMCKPDCSCGCKGQEICECCTEEIEYKDYIQNTCKKFIMKCKEEVKGMIDVAIDVFKRLKGHEPPFMGKFKKKFVKAAAKLLHKMYMKGQGKKDKWNCIAEKYWECHFEKCGKKMKYKVKKLAKRIMYYQSEGCDKVYQMCGTKLLTRLMIMLIRKKKEAHMEECKKEHEKESTGMHEGGKEKLMQKALYDLMKSKKKSIIKRKLKKICIKFGLEYLKENSEAIHGCLNSAKAEVDNCLKGCIEYDEHRKNKFISKIVTWTLFTSYGEKKSSEFYSDQAKRYFHGHVACSSKKVMRKQRKYPKHAMMLNGVKDKNVLHIGKRWGAIMACQAYGKEGCPKEKVVDFISKWIKDYVPIIESALKIMCESMKEHGGYQHGEYRAKKKCRKFVFKYLVMNCTDKKFNGEDFKKYIKEQQERKSKFLDKYFVHGYFGEHLKHEELKKPEEKK